MTAPEVLCPLISSLPVLTVMRPQRVRHALPGYQEKNLYGRSSVNVIALSMKNRTHGLNAPGNAKLNTWHSLMNPMSMTYPHRHSETA